MSFIGKFKTSLSSNKKLQEEGKQQLLKGELGLKKTFWGYWFLITLFINVCSFFTDKYSHILFLNAASIYVGITAFIAVKNTLTDNNKRWGITALIIVGSSLFLDALFFVGVIFE